MFHLFTLKSELFKFLHMNKIMNEWDAFWYCNVRKLKWESGTCVQSQWSRMENVDMLKTCEPNRSRVIFICMFFSRLPFHLINITFWFSPFWVFSFSFLPVCFSRDTFPACHRVYTYVLPSFSKNENPPSVPYIYICLKFKSFEISLPPRMRLGKSK